MTFEKIIEEMLETEGSAPSDEVEFWATRISELMTEKDEEIARLKAELGNR